MSRRDTEATVEFECTNELCDAMPSWQVEGRFNAEGEFEPNNVDEMGSDADCPECGERGAPADIDIEMAS